MLQIVLQIKNFVEIYFVICCSEYASGVRNLYCQGDYVLKSCLPWVPQCICLDSYKACSKKFLCWGRPRPEFQTLAVEKDIHHLQDLYTCQFFALPLQPQPYQGLQTDPVLIPQELLTNSPWNERQTVWSLLIGPVEVSWF